MTIRFLALASLLFSAPHAAIGARTRRSNEAASDERLNQYSATALAEGWPLGEGAKFQRPTAAQLALKVPADVDRVAKLVVSRGVIGRIRSDGTRFVMPVNRAEIWKPTT